MDLSDAVLGQSTTRALRTKAESVLLRIGKDTFTRGDLSRLSCFNFTAAANLSAILNATLKVSDTRDVFMHVHPSALAVPRLGAVSLAVLGAAFEAKKLGGDAPLEQWVARHRDGDIVTFHTMKQQAAAQDAQVRGQRKRRGRAA